MTDAEGAEATAEGETVGDTQTERERLLASLRDVRAQATYKTTGKGRVRDPEKAQIRIKYLRLIVQAANAERRILQDRDLDDIEERLSTLEDARGITAGGA